MYEICEDRCCAGHTGPVLPVYGEWSVTNKTAIPYDDVAAYMNFGTERASAYRILEDTLNLRDVRIYDTIRDGDTRSAGCSTRRRPPWPSRSSRPSRTLSRTGFEGPPAPSGAGPFLQ